MDQQRAKSLSAELMERLACSNILNSHDGPVTMTTSKSYTANLSEENSVSTTTPDLVRRPLPHVHCQHV